MTKMTDTNDTAPLQTFAVHYCRTDRSGEVFIELISAVGETAAQAAFEQVFTNADVVAVRRTGDTAGRNTVPGARFINGQFHPVDGQDDWPVEPAGSA